MRIIKYILKCIIIFLIIINLLIIAFGKTYLYKGLSLTYFKGKTGPDIEDYKFFYNDTILHDKNTFKWLKSKKYNKNKIPSYIYKKIKKYATTAFLVIQNDSIKYEEYFENFDSTKRGNSFSMAKSIISILIGIAIDEGKIKNIDEPVSNYLLEFKKKGRNKITFRNLLTMSSGLNWTESGKNPLSDNAQAYYGSKLKRQIKKLRLIDQPGIKFKYQSGNSQILSFALENATGKTISKYAEEKLWSKIGTEYNALWTLDKKNGDERAFCCFYSVARDFAKIGRLYLNKGYWEGKQIVSKKWVEESLKPATYLIDDENKKVDFYGLHWWILNLKEIKGFYARGILGQYIIVIPELKLIIVRLGHKRSKLRYKHHPLDLFVYIDAALKIL